MVQVDSRKAKTIPIQTVEDYGARNYNEVVRKGMLDCGFMENMTLNMVEWNKSSIMMMYMQKIDLRCYIGLS